ncbi:MAG: hypothetical protein NXI16_09815 [Alphaproteobacteria bacterium]|nr:hypothetical protein [Alphaproteobacteria bacterium]
MAESDISTPESAGMIKKKGRFAIDLGHPLPELDTRSADAYAGSSEKDASLAFAMLCHVGAIPRWQAIRKMIGKDIDGGLTLIDADRISLPHEGRHRLALIYKRPAGGDFFRLKRETLSALPPAVAIKRYLKPAVAALKDLHARDITHRAIRVDNFLYPGGQAEMILGDCLTAPPGSEQPRTLEPLPMAGTDPMGRGAGTPEDDLFALGTLLLELCLGHALAPPGEDGKLLIDRFEFGTVNAYTNRLKIPVEIEDAVRGLLNDDPKERWSLRELEDWIGGHAPKPKHSRAPGRAARPLVVAGDHCYTRQGAADALGAAWQRADPLIKSSDFDGWLRRGLSEVKTAKSIAELMADSKLRPALRVSRALILLDPPGPIRFNGTTAHLGGVGAMMVANRDRGEVRQALAQIIDARLAVHWIAAQDKARDETLSKHIAFDRANMLLAGGDGGLGYERVMYELCPDIHCLSPVLEDQMIFDLAQFLPALENAAKNKRVRGEVIDNHMLGFIAARHKSLSDSWIRSINKDHDRYGQVVAVVRILSYLQQHYTIGPLPNFCQRVETLLRPVVTEFKNKMVRKRILETIEKAAKSGMLTKMLAPIDDPKALVKDKKQYKEAVRDHAKAARDIYILRNNADRIRELSHRIGEQAGAAVAGVVGSIIVVVVLFDALVNS